MRNKFVLFIFTLLIASLTVLETTGQTKSFPVGKGGSLEVETSGGDITISPWEKDEVVVNASGISERDRDELSMTQTGNTVRVEYRGHGGNPRFQINVPSQFNLNLNTAGGDMAIEGAMTGQIKGATSGGDIRLADVNGQVDMSTSGGDVSAGKVQGNANLSTSGGDIRLGTVAGEVQVTTSGGDISVENVGKMLKATTAGGDVTAGDVGGDATLTTAGGDVRVGKVSGSVKLTTAGGDIQLNGGNGTVAATTAGGDIALRNVSGSIKAKTAGGDITAELVPSGEGTSNLVTAGGDIRLFLPENARARISARIRLEGRQREEANILSDFKAEQQDKTDREIRATFVLNGGGENITLETVNSNVEIRRLAR